MIDMLKIEWEVIPDTLGKKDYILFRSVSNADFVEDVCIASCHVRHDNLCFEDAAENFFERCPRQKLVVSSSRGKTTTLNRLSNSSRYSVKRRAERNKNNPVG